MIYALEAKYLDTVMFYRQWSISTKNWGPEMKHFNLLCDNFDSDHISVEKWFSTMWNWRSVGYKFIFQSNTTAAHFTDTINQKKSN